MRNLRIDADGSLVYTRDAIDPRTGKNAASNVVAGRVALARFPAASRLDTADGRSFYAPEGVSPHTGLAADGSFDAGLMPMRRAHSRVRSRREPAAPEGRVHRVRRASRRRVRQRAFHESGNGRREVRVLAFDAPKDGNRVREARFVERSSLPLSAACLVASAVREALSSIVNAPVTARLLEPVVPSTQAWAAIARGAALYRFRGSVADAAIVLRPPDAAALAAAIFGERIAEPAPSQRPLSPDRNARYVLDRAAGAIAGTLNAVCGPRERESLERVATICGYVSYFEIVVEQAVDARIGIALSNDPAPEPHGALEIETLSGVALSPAVRLDLDSADAAALARLTVGTLLPLSPRHGFRGRFGRWENVR